MNDKKERRIAVEDRRDTASDKRKIKKAVIAVACALLALCLLYGVLALTESLLKKRPTDDISYDDYRFFPADYDANLLENRMYTSLNRSIYFDKYGSETVLTEADAVKGEASGMFLDYFDCLVKGRYEDYRSFFTEEYLEEYGEELPARFTMQGVYDIHVKLHSKKKPIEDNEELSAEVYEVSYRIFENNGTFRRDILPDETRTLVFEVYIFNGEAKINAIANRANG